MRTVLGVSRAAGEGAARPRRAVRAVPCILLVLAATCALGLLVTGCASDGGGSGRVPISRIVARLRSDSRVQGLKSQLGGNVQVFDAMMTCVAKAISKDADQAKLRAYVAGRASLNSLGSPSQDQRAEADFTSCARSAMGSG